MSEASQKNVSIAINVSVDGVLAIGALLFLLPSYGGLADTVELNSMAQSKASVAANLTGANPPSACQFNADSGPDMVIISAGSFSQNQVYEVTKALSYSQIWCMTFIEFRRQFVVDG